MIEETYTTKGEQVEKEDTKEGVLYKGKEGYESLKEGTDIEEKSLVALLEAKFNC